MASVVLSFVRYAVLVTGVAGLFVACGSNDAGSGGGLDGGATIDDASIAFGEGGQSDGAIGGCTPATCASQGIECGPAGDGCGGLIANCGACSDGKRCGGPGAPSQCVSPTLDGGSCTPKTCSDLGIECGPSGDGCGGVLQCGSCATGQRCGADNAFSKCVDVGPVGADGGACVPKTCADYTVLGQDCGSQTDGCGGVLNCGTCTAPAFCGGGGASKCGGGGVDGGTCTPKTCSDYAAQGIECGPQPDGCGSLTANCGTCPSPTTCGGGGVASKCGGGSVQGVDGGACVATTCALQGKDCGTIADGCGGVLNCGSTCAGNQVCGGAGTANVCGTPVCTPITTCPTGMNCGIVADGCGGTVTCGTGGCTSPAICGGGGKANVCGGGVVTAPDGGTCTPATCASLNKNCGQVADGCGGLTANCGSCSSPAICGGGGTANVCGGGTTCTPATCSSLGKNCGYVADGCGGVLSCGTCGNGAVCGGGVDGGGSPNVCSGTAGGTCTGLCQQQVTCDSGTTTVTGRVFAPNGTLPIYDALVYVPNAALGTITDGATCDTCAAQASGAPLVSAHTDNNGNFAITNMPVGTNIPLVMQVGKWRRQVTIPSVPACATTAIDNSLTRLPKNQTEGNIPKIAVTTGSADALQCLFRKLGIDDTEFTQPTGSGRINLYSGSGGTSKYKSGFNGYNTNATRNLPTAVSLVSDPANLKKYDAVFLTCEGGAGDNQGDYASYRPNMQTYADAGGRIFASHWHHAWLEYGSTEWKALATINHQRDLKNPSTADINQTFTKGSALASWLINAGSPGPNGKISITAPQHTISAVSSNATNWISIASPTDDQNNSTNASIQYFTFNAPVPTVAVPAPNQCGRMVVSDLHVFGNASTNPPAGVDDTDANFPDGCVSTTLDDQQKALIFMLFDLTACIQADTPVTPTCAAKTCVQQGIGCGLAGDGCGGQLNCGTCSNGQTCGGGGVASQCGGPTCTAKTCAQLSATCGTVPDGCGNTKSCGSCPTGQTCGGNGTPYQCGAPTCTALTCTGQGIQCGPAGDGCGGTLSCGTCPNGTTCGGGGLAGKCGAPSCTPITTCPAGMVCGQYPNGCGGSINCGSCATGQTCGGGGTANSCGSASCTPKTCVSAGAACGPISDGCGNIVDCGSTCPSGQVCSNNQCTTPACTPTTCTAQGVSCGAIADGCGGLLQCGSCANGQTCGGGGVSGQCGGPSCTPRTCASLGAACGQVADGCGGLTAVCGTCATNQTCSNGTCQTTCVPRTCADAGANCGKVADGCGGLTADCGTCPAGQTCGANGVANVCSGAIIR